MTDSPEMPTGNAQEPEQDAAARQARYQAILERLTLMSDLFARNVLKDKACAEYILQVIMEDSSLRIVSLDIQADLKNLYGRSATLDCIAQDAADMHSAVLAGRVRELKETQKGVSYMCSELRMLREEGLEEGIGIGREEGREEGISIGLEKGKLIMLYDLVRDGTLPLSAAAARARQDDSEFQAGMERYFASAG